MLKGSVLLFVILSFLGLIIAGIYFFKPKNSVQVQEQQVAISTPSPSPFVFSNYSAPKIERKDVYNVVMIGDSMTHALGPRGGTMSEYVNKLYKPHNIFISIDNYAIGGANILNVDDQLNKNVTYWDSTFEPLLSRNYDLILVESFAYNPLSEFGIEGGIKRQNDALTELMTKLVTTHPNSAIVFIATISPNRVKYAEEVTFNILPIDRSKQAEERIAYLKNHIEYAKSHNIPLVNIYEKSLNIEGDGDLQYINPDDFIHPSAVGVNFIGHEIANFIFYEQILPK